MIHKYEPSSQQYGGPNIIPPRPLLGIAVLFEDMGPGFRETPQWASDMANKMSDVRSLHPERDFFIENLLVRNHFIIVMISWTGLAPWEFEFLFSGSPTSTFLHPDLTWRHIQFRARLCGVLRVLLVSTWL